MAIQLMAGLKRTNLLPVHYHQGQRRIGSLSNLQGQRLPEGIVQEYLSQAHVISAGETATVTRSHELMKSVMGLMQMARRTSIDAYILRAW